MTGTGHRFFYFGGVVVDRERSWRGVMCRACHEGKSWAKDWAPPHAGALMPPEVAQALALKFEQRHKCKAPSSTP